MCKKSSCMCKKIFDDSIGFFSNILLEEFVDYSLIFMRSWYSVGGFPTYLYELMV